MLKTTLYALHRQLNSMLHLDVDSTVYTTYVLWFLSSPTQPPFFLIYKEPFNLDLYYFAKEKAMVIGANFKFLKPS
jgi:hypothetical protein